MPVMAAAPGVSGLEKLTCRHAVKLSPPQGCPWRSAVWLWNDLLLRELSRHGRVVSLMRLIPLGSKSLLLSHVVSFRRQVSMVLNNNKEELNLALVTTDSLKCFGCGEESHVIWSCPNNTEARRPANPPRAQRDELCLEEEELVFGGLLN
ncbi:hypothetical protein D4764_02G0002280 [Takifugu flavidus]|uniref:CCHC-type domain-containing protein n=1 Tax=Takifugu flavidus TaxID=433684 RepID=A0A5C6NNJ3_9TELE|nr:hypothetical protein D4764_02G0002280 [Takifugu flavidus]